MAATTQMKAAQEPTRKHGIHCLASLKDEDGMVSNTASQTLWRTYLRIVWLPSYDYTGNGGSSERSSDGETLSSRRTYDREESVYNHGVLVGKVDNLHGTQLVGPYEPDLQILVRTVIYTLMTSFETHFVRQCGQDLEDLHRRST